MIILFRHADISGFDTLSDVSPRFCDARLTPLLQVFRHFHDAARAYHDVIDASFRLRLAGDDYAIFALLRRQHVRYFRCRCRRQRAALCQRCRERRQRRGARLLARRLCR